MKRYIGLASRAGAIACCLLFLVGCEKSRLDEEVRQLCAKDGGIKIYETVKLPSERFDQHGNIKIPSKKDANPSDEYYYESETIFLRSGNPDLRRSHDKIIRRHDQKVLGEFVYYARRGGNISGPWHESYFGCSGISKQQNFESSIFTKDGEK